MPRSFEYSHRQDQERDDFERSYSPNSFKRRQRSQSKSPDSNKRHMGFREDPEPSRCIGVFGLSMHTGERELDSIFRKYGSIERVQVVLDGKTGNSRGFAFIYYDHFKDAAAAKQECSGMIVDGRQIRVDYSITQRPHTPTPGSYMGKPTSNSDDYRQKHKDQDRPFKKNRSPSPRYRSKQNNYNDNHGHNSRSVTIRQHADSGSRDSPEPTRCLGVFGLSTYTDEAELENIFHEFGNIEKIQVIMDSKTGNSRGFAFVYFERLRDATAAKCECSGIIVRGRQIRVDYSFSERAHTPTPGIYLGKSTSIRDDFDRDARRRLPSPRYKSNYDDDQHRERFSRYTRRSSEKKHDDRYDRNDRGGGGGGRYRSRSRSPHKSRSRYE